MNIKHSIFLPVLGFGLLFTTNYFQPYSISSKKRETNKEQEKSSLSSVIKNSSWKFSDKNMKISFLNKNGKNLIELENLKNGTKLNGEYKLLFDKHLVATIYKDKSESFDIALNNIVYSNNKLYASLNGKRASLARVA